MKYRKFGNLGWEVSELGLGSEQLDGKSYNIVEEVIHECLEQGINIMDLFMPGKEIRTNIGRALGSRRKDMYIQGQIGSCDLNEQYDITRDLDITKRYFDELLSSLGTDYIDLGMLFFIDTDKDFNDIFNSKIIDYALDLKNQGVIRALGFTSHDPLTAIKVVNTGLVDAMMFSINLAFDMTPAKVNTLTNLKSSFKESEYSGIDNVIAELYSLCENKNIPITVMKAFGAGRLLNKDLTPFHKPMTVAQCIHYALTRPGVKSVLAGYSSKQEVIDAMKYFDMSDEEKDYSEFGKAYNGKFKGNCLYCSHCLPCPSNIDIAELHRQLDIAKLDVKNIPELIKENYNSLDNHGSDCIKCGSCESKCPFSVPVMENMDKAVEIFGK